MNRASESRIAYTVAEGYEEWVFRRFDASIALRHGRKPRFMPAFFRAFNRMVGERQQDTMVYRRQVNGMAEGIMPTLTRPNKFYVAGVGQQD